ncbi:hypothetical protein EON81_08455 [bacterium]|nr:MAG: hypothetical protein EON81_08455 [bacterium]
MKRPLPLLVAVFLAGCQNGGTAKGAPAEVAESSTPIGAPSEPGPSKLFLIGDNTLLRIGDDAADSQKAFPPPKGSFPLSDLPDRFRAPYTARGWDAAREGFGAILYDDKIVGAMIQNERVDANVAEELQARYNRELSSITPVEVTSDAANFTFWDDEKQRLMLVVQKMSDKTVRTTVALGDNVVMDALGASVERARQDGQQLDALLKELREKSDGKTTTGTEKAPQ